MSEARQDAEPQQAGLLGDNEESHWLHLDSVLRRWGIGMYNEGVSRHGEILKRVWTRSGGNRMAPLNILREAEADGLSFVHYSLL